MIIGEINFRYVPTADHYIDSSILEHASVVKRVSTTDYKIDSGILAHASAIKRALTPDH